MICSAVKFRTLQCHLHSMNDFVHPCTPGMTLKLHRSPKKFSLTSFTINNNLTVYIPLFYKVDPASQIFSRICDQKVNHTNTCSQLEQTKRYIQQAFKRVNWTNKGWKEMLLDWREKKDLLVIHNHIWTRNWSHHRNECTTSVL